jgi:signal peptidase II
MKKRHFAYFALSLAVFIVDQYTKHLVRRALPTFETIHVMSVLNLVHVENVGSAFGLFKSLGNIFFIVVASFASLAVAFLIVKDSDNRTAFSLILGGAVGNLADRMKYGHVVDFLDLHIGNHHWPAFNIADAALTAGILLVFVQLVVQMFRSRRHE